jgi:23S rRNA pseudouridine1911/1915/1917 synthase
MGRAALVQAELQTGRTHQVRVHLAALGCPILGDSTYGRPPRDADVRAIARSLGRQALHARVLGFFHPKSQAWLEFQSEPPADFACALQSLRALAVEDRAKTQARGTPTKPATPRG